MKPYEFSLILVRSIGFGYWCSAGWNAFALPSRFVNIYLSRVPSYQHIQVTEIVMALIRFVIEVGLGFYFFYKPERLATALISPLSKAPSEAAEPIADPN